MWVAVGLDTVGLKIPIIRQLIGFIYLTFIPGILILRILKLHNLGNIETILYTVGLSIATLMFTGFFINMVYPFLGISKPLLIAPVIITISAIVLVLCVISYVRDDGFSDPNIINVEDVLSPPALFLRLIPFLSVFGTYLVNFYNSNVLLMFLIIVIALIVGFGALNRFIPIKLYPLVVVIIAISLLYHRTLISAYLTGTDIHVEYYFYEITKLNCYWNPTIAHTYSSMLSVTILPVIYSCILNMNGVGIFKILYPFIFALVPLGLYHVYKNQTNEKIAFLSKIGISAFLHRYFCENILIFIISS